MPKKSKKLKNIRAWNRHFKSKKKFIEHVELLRVSLKCITEESKAVAILLEKLPMPTKHAVIEFIEDTPKSSISIQHNYSKLFSVENDNGNKLVLENPLGLLLTITVDASKLLLWLRRNKDE